MRKSKFTETQILTILKENEAGMTVAEISRKYGVSNGTFYKWKNKYAGMNGSEIRKMRQLEDENLRLKKMFADLSLENRVLKELIEKNF